MATAQDNFLEIKKELNTFLLSLADKNNFFVSVAVVGSHAEPKEMETMNDLDVVFIFDQLDRAKWEATIKGLGNFCTTHSDDQLGVIIETRFGPFKTDSGKPITVQIHALMFDIQGFQDYAKISPLVVSDWYRFPVLFGKTMADIAPIPPVTADDIIKARGGIDYAIEQIRDGVNIAVTVSFDDDGKPTKSIEKLPQNGEQRAETYFKSIKNILLNIWKLETKTNTKASDEEVESLGKKIIGEDNFNIVKDLEVVYKRARSGENISDDEISVYQRQAGEILTLIKEYLNR